MDSRGIFALAEWQRFDDENPRAIFLDRAVLADILLADAPWGYVASLSHDEFAAYLDQHEAAVRKNKPTTTEQKPFPLGPPPDLERTNPAKGRREKVIRIDKATQEPVFNSSASDNPHTPYNSLLDQSYAQLMLRLHPVIFVTLYHHERKHGRIGVCRRDRASNQKNVDESRNIQLGGVEVCTPALLCALIHSYVSGQYQRLTLEQILCYVPYGVCRYEAHIFNRSNAFECLRHYRFVVWTDTLQRSSESQRDMSQSDGNGKNRYAHVPLLHRRYSICNEFDEDFEDLKELTLAEARTNTNIESPKSSPTYTISTITTSGSSEVGVHALQASTEEVEESADKHPYRKNLVDSSSSHPLRAPYRPSSSCSQSNASSLLSRPKSFWPSSTGPPIKQLSSSMPLVEPVALRAASSESLTLLQILATCSKSAVSSTNGSHDKHGGNQQKPTNMVQLMWNSSSTLPVSNSLEQYTNVGDVHHAGANDRVLDGAPLDVDRSEVQLSIPQAYMDETAAPELERQATEASTIKSVSDLNTTYDSDADSDATQCSKHRVAWYPRPEAEAYCVAVPMTDTLMTKSSDGTVKSYQSDAASEATQCSSPVSVTTIDIDSIPMP